MSPQRGGWEAIQPMLGAQRGGWKDAIQPVLGDEDPDDCNPWTSDELTVAFIVVGFLVVMALDGFGLTKVFQ
jgi:hypothetical protein